MNTSPKIIAFLQLRYFDEVVAEMQYRSHAAIMKRKGYVKAADQFIEHADDEAKHKVMLAKRLAQFGVAAEPFGGKLDLTKIGAELELTAMLDAQKPLESKARDDYNAGIRLCCEEGDNDTRMVLDAILVDETDHLDDIERLEGNIEDIGLDNALQWLMG